MQDERADAPEPRLVFAFTLEVEVGPPQELGELNGLRRRIIPILGGRVSGDHLSGVILPGGADWQDVRPADGFTRLHARYWLRLTDGAVVAVENVGLRRASPEVSARLLAGEAVSPEAYYFRTTPRFEVAPGPHAWLAESVFVAAGVREPESVIVRAYRVL